MSKRLDENIGAVGYDGLIVSNDPVADVVTVEFPDTPAGIVKRGTVISGTPGGKDFAALAAAVADGKALTAADEEALRKSGILLSDALDY